MSRDKKSEVILLFWGMLSFYDFFIAEEAQIPYYYEESTFYDTGIWRKHGDWKK